MNTMLCGTTVYPYPLQKLSSSCVKKNSSTLVQYGKKRIKNRRRNTLLLNCFVELFALLELTTKQKSIGQRWVCYLLVKRRRLLENNTMASPVATRWF